MSVNITAYVSQYNSSACGWAAECKGEVMENFKKKLLNLLLFPVKAYEKLTDGKATLIAGIVLIGVIDFLLPDVMFIIKNLFIGKSTPDIVYNAGMAVLVLLLLGFIDVICISAPLFDIAGYLKKKETQFIMNTGIGARDQKPPLQPSVFKVMKVYIVSHFIIIPVSLALNYLFSLDTAGDGSVLMQNLLLILFMALMVWHAAIMTRGIDALFRMNMLFQRLLFIIVFTWNFLFGMVFDAMIVDWLMRLFR